MTDTAFPLTNRQLRYLLSQECEMAGSQSAFAARRGIPVSVICETLSGKRSPSDTVLAAMGLMRVTRYISTRRGLEAVHAPKLQEMSS